MSKRILNEVSRLRREEASKSILSFARLYLSHHLKHDPAPAHLAIYNLLFNILLDRGRKIAIAASRDFGKSTMITLINILFCLCYAKERFIMVISNTSSQAIQILDNVLRELCENPLFQSDFPELFGPDGRLVRSRQGEIITHNGIKVVALGSGQQVRGRRFGNARPGFVIADDLESAETTYNEEARQKMKNWFEKSVLKVGTRDTNYIFIGNLYHPFCLLAEYVNKEQSPGWESFVYSAIISWPTSKKWEEWRNVRSFRSSYKGSNGPLAARQFYEANKTEMNEGVMLLWPQRYDIGSLMELNEDNPLSFMSEYQNTPTDFRVCPFQLEQFHYWSDAYQTTEQLLRTMGENVEYFLACDPSVGEAVTKGDYSAIAIIARDTKTKTMYLIEADIQRRPVDELLKDILAYCKRYKFRKIGFESNNFQSLIISNFKKMLSDGGLYQEVVSLTNSRDKIKRVLEIMPYLKTGQLQLSRHQKLFLEQLQLFPRGKNDDGPDAVEMVVRLCVESTNNFCFWFAGGGPHYPPEPGDPPRSTAPKYPTPDGLVPYGFYGWNRRG
ncbi:MAG: phage terminase large subunit [Candidatus Omnitrophica bacterium]|nr:phage terminase large subunit [Candidatus Omnitrophota bacterium]